MKHLIGKQYILVNDSKFAWLEKGLVVTAESIDKLGVVLTYNDGECDTFTKVTHKRFLRCFELYEPSKPTHYDTGIDPIAYMRTNYTPEQVEGFLVGNVLKYITRYNKKNGVDDLRKAKHYVEMLIEELEASE